MEIQADINKNTEFDLTNVQMAYLMGRDKQFELGGTSTHAYLEIETELNIEKLNKSLQKVIDYQDMLVRSSFRMEGKRFFNKSLSMKYLYRILVN
ncbi:hypothetical protein [Bacillus velezensis]|uniref:hypothetical protein n=1 Tax=Bacillus velezensis TaxID=492670 RepID=UPI003BF7394E